MKELAKYQCEYCNTEYNDKKKAEECEKNHKVKPKIKASHWLPLGMDHSGYPLDVNITFEDGNVIKYKRG